MADNITIKDGAGVDQPVACDEVSRNATTEKQQIMKIGLGAEGAHDLLLDSGQQTMANSLPVALASDHSDIKVTLDGESVTVGSHAVTNAGTFAVQDSEKIADDGGFTVGATKVQPVGYLVDDASPDAADEGDAVAARVTLDRKQLVMLGESGANLVRGGGNKTDTSDQSIMGAPGSGFFNYLCWIAVYNASSTNTYVNMKEGSNVVAVIPLPAYGGAVLSLPVPIRGADNAVIALAAGVGVTTASLYGGGYKGK